jgi:ketosteroid isomerase-like protein
MCISGTPEERCITAYFDAFNRHDLDGVLACFRDDVALVDSEGKRIVGLDAARALYAQEFESMPDAHCELVVGNGHAGYGVAESVFHGTTLEGRVIEAVGAEVMEFVDGRISVIRDYHQMRTGG